MPSLVSATKCSDNIIPILLKIFQKLKKRDHFLTHLYEANIVLIPKTDTDMYIQNNYRPVYLVNIDAKPTTKILAIHSMTLYYKYDYTVKGLHIIV